ncbi:ASKHA domain-containing protein [Anaerocolumna aminovalerica]|uniref:ASKHA domain-containing protein n=1 Tax=Anaerocolumna aminovalerica TaxID=1527 RepID=UPI00248CD7BF|nr:ASKHA domain-containing protein [Anaerocolumna aminovalerica]
MLVTFLPMNKKIQINAGSNLFHAAMENGIDFGGVCSGNRTCGKCKAMITKGNNRKYSKEERKLLTEEERNSGIRLTCCFTITEDTCVIISGKKEKQSQVSRKEDKIEDSFGNLLTNSLAKEHYGIALDIGTTSVAARLWNLDRKEFIDEISTKNPQSLYGADVITRITYANSSGDNVRRLAYLIRECCNTLLLRLSAEHNINTNQIEAAVITANTTMSHLFLGKSVEKLAKVPFQGISYEGVKLKASDVGFQMHPNGQVYVMPGIAGHVGSDTLGCILAKDLNHAKGNHLLVDIGTNGEIVLAKEGELMVCSTAAGPAFEGASLHQGMRAIEGAISKVNIRNNLIEVELIGPEKGSALTYSMNRNGKAVGEIGDIYPIGICGSGVIEAISELLNNHIMDETGRLLGQEGDNNYVTLWKHHDKEVILTQKDIRELQLAKGAIYTGIMLLLKEAELSKSQLNYIYLAGAFGSSIDLKKAVHIGLLPPIEPDRINYIGNGALDGASKVLLGQISKAETESISKKIKHLELALCKEFQEEFLKAVNF